MIVSRVIFLLAAAILLGYVSLRVLRGRNAAEPLDERNGFRPRIGFTRLDGMQTVSLLLDNGSDEFVWGEELEIFLSGLTAEQQTAEPTCHETQKILQMVPGGDTLPISLAQVIYRSAGDPQRKYTCVLSSVLRYRIGEVWFEKKMENYRIQMMGLKASSIHRERKPVQAFPAQDKSHKVAAPWR